MHRLIVAGPRRGIMRRQPLRSNPPRQKIGSTLHMPGESLRIKGQIIAKEDLHFEGQIEGTISVPEHTLTVGKHARLEADVQAKAVVVAGMLSGSVSAVERFELQANGSLEGTLEAPRVQIVEGALLHATVAMPPRKVTPAA
jgi:cytoskeletal protein CcmA (bactofilin family)